MLGALPAELRGSQQLSLLIDDQRTRLLNGQSPSPQQAMEQPAVAAAMAIQR